MWMWMAEKKITLSPSILLGSEKEFPTFWYSAPFATYRAAISTIEVCLDSADQTLTRERLAITMNEMSHNIGNRSFGYGLLLTESKVTAYMFDHLGALVSNGFEYYRHPK
ncbi:hypothetical protein M422DRAFT_46396 [Sphaerobolus stellatus SS14]|uniref:Uncharacterized protein n=1 Tax=Sphaerobolus stellatus (strain SS14) TaxID=990650 RepID=A0A0C9VU08_SPHS4|nr:hypothetical protein M422DRAFT_46396 [Sphaerobolus stellatus SS14]